MATRLYLRNTVTAPGVASDALRRDLRPASGSSTIILGTRTDDAGTEIQVGTAGSGTTTGAAAFTSERVASTVTVSGDITVHVWTSELSGLINAGLRAKLWARTEGGSDVETLIAQGDYASELPATTGMVSWTITPIAGVTVGLNERFVLRLYVIPVGGTMAASAPSDGVSVRYDGTAGALAESWIELTETVTFLANLTTFYLRRTAANGIGTFFDLLTTRGASAFTTGVVNTVGSGTNIQWTRTAGGTVLEWISPRLASGFQFADPGGTQEAAKVVVWALESQGTANCAVRARLYRWRAGAETEVGVNSSAELGTSAAAVTLWFDDPSVITAADFLPDDRIILRLFITNVGTMGSAKTCTVDYDHNVASVDGDSYMTLLWTPDFKAEGDTTPEHQSRMTMGGVGN